ncbi:MAG: hypothetical protein ACRDXE_07770 [Acidimicrobiales bacterium]
MTDPSEARDSEVLRMRNTGSAFARISRDLKLQRPIDAQQAFRRAFDRLTSDEQVLVRQQEAARLDRLVTLVNADASTPADERTRRLASIERLRTLLDTAQ